MLWTILVILLVLWLLGFLSHVGGGMIHLLLVIAAIVLVINLVVWPAHGLGDLGRFATLLEVVNHYNSFKGLNLTDQEKRDLVEYLKSL